jgi:hypothetical protein
MVIFATPNKLENQKSARAENAQALIDSRDIIFYRAVP